MCKSCGGQTDVPTGVADLRFRCTQCGAEHFTKDYVSDVERLALAVTAATSGKQDYEAKKQSGVTCKTCGGHLELPSDPSAVAVKCGYCGAEQLISDYVAPQVLAAAQMQGAMQGMLEEAQAKRRKTTILILSLLALAGIAALVVAILRG